MSSSQGLGQVPPPFQPFEYINPLIRGNQLMDPTMMYDYGPGYSYTNQPMSNQDNSLMIQDGFMSEGSTTENVPPIDGDLTQYINPEIHSVHPALRSNSAFNTSRKQPRPDAYKTVMCQAWLESQRCSFGADCKFAHGTGELRPAKFPIRNSLKYKTKLCDKYTTTGICPYGNRCLFIHPDPANSAKYRQSAIAQQIVRQSVGMVPFSSSSQPQSLPPLSSGNHSPLKPFDSSHQIGPPMFSSSAQPISSNSSRPHPSWPLEAPGFYRKDDGRCIMEMARQERAVGSPEVKEEELRVAARAAAAAAKKSGAALGMTEDQLAYHLARQLAELQRSHSSSIAYDHVLEEQNAKLNQTHSMPNSRHSSISPFSNASTESTSGVWSAINVGSDSSPLDVKNNDVFYPEEDTVSTPKFFQKRPPRTQSDVSNEMATPCAVSKKDVDGYNMFHTEQFAQNIAKVLDL